MADSRNRISYGTPAQFASLLRSIKANVDEEPDDYYEDPAVREEAEALVEALNGRLNAAVGQ